MSDTFTVSRSVVIAAPPASITPEISDLARHNRWSPFAKPDPKLVERIEGGAGVGQTRTFSGGRTGAGKLTVDTVDPERIGMTLVMTKPFKSTNAVAYDLAPEAGGTRVTWSMSGKKTLAGKVMGLFFDADAMMGRMFDQGLAALKAEVEARHAGGNRT